MESVEGYLAALESGQINENLIYDAINFLKNQSSENIDLKKKEIAQLFFCMVKSTQLFYDKKIIEKQIKDIILSFENIKQLFVQLVNTEEEISYIVIIHFLNELYLRYSDSNYVIDQSFMKKNIGLLLNQLKEIDVLFDFKDENGQSYFPITKLIESIITDTEFLASGEDKIYQFNVIQLAVRYFIEENDKLLLKKFKENFNLKFLDYLNENSILIDTNNLDNFRNNNVMIFFNQRTHKVLIRNENLEYFKGKNIEKEINYQGKTICYFYEAKIENYRKLTSFDEIMQEENNRFRMLEILFKEKKYNIFMKNALVETDLGEFIAINSFCDGEEFIINNEDNGNFKSFKKSGILEVIKKYRTCFLKTSSLCPMNNLSFGLCANMFSKDNLFHKFNTYEFVDNEFYQNQFIKLWIESDLEKLDYFMNLVANQLSYCKRIKSKPKKLSVNDSIENHLICIQDLFPYSFDYSYFLPLFSDNEMNDLKLLQANIDGDDDEDCLNIAGKKVRLDSVLNGEKLWDNDFFDYESDDIYILYDEKSKIYLYNENQNLLKKIYGANQINKNCLSYEICEKVNLDLYLCLKEKVNIYKETLQQVGNNIFFDNDCHVFYRIIHNMLGIQLKKENVYDYFNIFRNYISLTFEEIINDDLFFNRDSSDTIYLPKDGYVADSTLKNIYNTYLTNKIQRETNNLFDIHLIKKEDGYYKKDKKIKHIMFLSDNYLYGNATKKMINSYLEINESEINTAFVNRHQKIYCGEKEVSVKDLYNENNCEISVHSFYGTEDGKTNIIQYLEDNKIRYRNVDYFKVIRNRYTKLKESIKKIWPKLSEKPYVPFSVIREFNMVKDCGLPKEVYGSFNQAMKLFVLKDEII